jgi:hypothetical protein
LVAVRTLPNKLASALRATTSNTRALAALTVVIGAFTAVAVRVHPSVHVLSAVYGLALFAVTALVLARARFDRVTILIVLGGLWLYLGYLGYTDYGERNYDGGEQLRYVQWIVDHHARPPATQCLICHHPPLYYALGALAYVFFQATKLAPPVTGLQLYSLVCHLVFIGFAVATARRLLGTRRELHLATALIVFWPYSVENTVRVHNDTLASTLMGVATFYVVRWAQKEKRRDLYLAALATGLGLLTKSSAYAVAGALFVLLVVRFFRSRDKLRFARRAVVAGAILLAAMALNARGKDTPTAKDAPLCHKILGNACDIHKGQWVDNKLKNYVWIDWKAFAKEPYALAERDGSGRAYFWGHLLKSSLFGTHNTTPDRETAFEVNRAIAYAMNALLLGMDAYLVLGALAFARRRALRRFEAVLVCLGMCIAFMMGFRVLIPAPHHTDFRHIFSSVALVSLLYAATLGRARGSWPALERMGRFMAVTFVVLSIVYFLPKHDLTIRLTTHVVHPDLAPYTRLMAEGTQWDRPGNLLIEENHIVEFAVPGTPTARELDVSLDNNDRYQIDIIGDDTRRLILGPRPDKKGLTRYVEKVDPPVANVRRVRVRPLSGDLAYSLGHLILR